ncbi:MAG: response regulator [Myxococcales bacterium]|nr:response regulator [Myxococcales bacterium]
MSPHTPAIPSVAGLQILVIDDDDVLRQRMARALTRRGLRVQTASGVVEAEAAAKADPPDLALVDLRMPDGDGLQLLRTLLELKPDMRVIMLTGYGSIATAIDAVRAGAWHYLPKPADAGEVVAAFLRDPDAPLADSNEQGETPSLARAEWEHVQRVLSECNGNISEAARRLGLHRRSLQRKLQKYPPRR